MYRVAQPAFVIVLLLYGVMTGFFYAYTVSVMWGLDLSQPQVAIAAMQGINTAVRNGVFLLGYLLPPIVSVFLSIALWRGSHKKIAVLLLVSALMYITGVLLPTANINVEMNNQLAGIDLEQYSGDIKVLWESYSERWQLWNTIRGGGCLVSFVVVIIAYGQWSKHSSVA